MQSVSVRTYKINQLVNFRLCKQFHTIKMTTDKKQF